MNSRENRIDEVEIPIDSANGNMEANQHSFCNRIPMSTTRPRVSVQF